MERFVKQVQRLDPLLVLPFGSSATGEVTQHSDVDILVVFARPVDWDTVYACSDGIVQPVVKTCDELVAQIDASEPFFCQIIQTGEVLFETGHIHDQLRQRVADACKRRGLERTATAGVGLLSKRETAG